MVVATLRVDAAILKGVVLANEVGGQPLENVQVSAAGTNPTVSDSFGMFTLEFPKRQPGETVRVLVKQTGQVVVNDVQLELALPANADDKVFTIVLCKEENREEMARRFYRLKSFDAIEESYRKRLKELEDTQQASAEALSELQLERDQAKAAAEKASVQLAKIQPGQDTELYRRAKRLFEAGKIDEALKLLDDQRLRSALAEAQKRREEADKAIQEAVQAWLLKGQLLTTQLRFEEANQAYLQAIEAKPDGFEANFAYGVFNQELNRFEKARAAYGRCLDWARKNANESELAKTLHNLGLLDHAQNRPDDARKEFR
jgi:tetratricopeptide (TPR) repeat protein